jgi:hypothetical protein
MSFRTAWIGKAKLKSLTSALANAGFSRLEEL